MQACSITKYVASANLRRVIKTKEEQQQQQQQPGTPWRMCNLGQNVWIPLCACFILTAPRKDPEVLVSHIRGGVRLDCRKFCPTRSAIDRPLLHSPPRSKDRQSLAHVNDASLALLSVSAAGFPCVSKLSWQGTPGTRQLDPAARLHEALL